MCTRAQHAAVWTRVPAAPGLLVGSSTGLVEVGGRGGSSGLPHAEHVRTCHTSPRPHVTVFGRLFAFASFGGAPLAGYGPTTGRHPARQASRTSRTLALAPKTRGSRGTIAQVRGRFASIWN